MDSRAQPTVAIIDEAEGKRYKALYYYEADQWELYCLTDDQGETKNLIQSKPEILATFSQKTQSWLTQDHSTWKPKFPIRKSNGKSAGPPPNFLK